MNIDATETKDNGIVIGTNGYLVNNLLKGLLIISIVIMFGATVSMSIDNIMAGHFIGSEAIAAMNISMPLFVAISLVSSIIANGGSALAARYLGQNQKQKVNSLFTFALLADLLVGIIIIACIYPNAGTIAEAVGARDDVVKEMAVQYIYGLLFGVLPIMFNATLLGFIRVAGNPHLSLASVLTMSAVNILFNYVFAGLLNMGMFGLAIATGSGYLASCIISIGYLLRKKCFLRFEKLGDIYKDAATIINLGLPSALTSLTSVVRGVALNVVVAVQLGTIVIKAMSVQSAIANLVGCASLGVGFTIIPLAGIFFGEQDKQALRKTMKGSLTLGLYINILLAIIISISARPLTFMFNITDPETVGMIVRSIWYFAASMPFAMVSYAFVCYFQNVNRVWLANTLIISKVVFMLIFTLPFINLLAENAIWLGGIFSEVMTLILTVIIVCVIEKKFPTSLDDLLLLPKEWNDGFPCYEVSLKNDMDACMGFSTKIQEFCAENGVSSKTSYYSALCLEEMVANIITHGFKDAKDHFIDIKVMITNSGTKLRIRDSGIEFNPIDYSEKLDAGHNSVDAANEQNDEFKNIGIKILRELAQSFDYRYTMRLNNLFIEIADEKALKLQPTQGNWQEAEQFLRQTLSIYKPPYKTAERIILASEELYGIAADTSTEEVTIKIKSLKNGVSIGFQLKGGLHDPSEFEDNGLQSIGLKIVRKTMDIFTYSTDTGKNSMTICKYW